MGSTVWKPPSVVSLLAVLWTQTLAPFPGFQLGRSACLAGLGPVVFHGHYFRSQGVAPVKPPQATEKPGGHSKPEAKELNLSVPLYHFRT